MFKKWILFILILAAAGAFFYFYFYLPKHKQKQDQLILYGNVDIRQVDIGFQVRGRVEKMFFEEGDLVKPGYLLAILDKRPYIDQVREAEANLEAVRINLKNSERLLKRRQELVNHGGISREDLENAITSHDVLNANLKQAEAALAISITNLQYTEVYAPTEGTILTRIREPGTVVGEGEAIYTISISSPVWIRAFVSEPQLGLIYPNMEANIHTDTSNGKVYQGKIGFISPVAEFTPKTVETTQLRTDLVYRLRIYSNNPDRGLRQGMPVTVYLPLTSSIDQEEK
jgi:HlyD family secretion protein